jgi:hypothetical protein
MAGPNIILKHPVNVQARFQLHARIFKILAAKSFGHPIAGKNG